MVIHLSASPSKPYVTISRHIALRHWFIEVRQNKNKNISIPSYLPKLGLICEIFLKFFYLSNLHGLINFPIT
jgi:hypothetical protein